MYTNTNKRDTNNSKSGHIYCKHMRVHWQNVNATNKIEPAAVGVILLYYTVAKATGLQEMLLNCSNDWRKLYIATNSKTKSLHWYHKAMVTNEILYSKFNYIPAGYTTNARRCLIYNVLFIKFALCTCNSRQMSVFQWC